MSPMINYALALLPLSGAMWWSMRCHHYGPLGLLPSVTDESGQRVPPRWYCDKCGKEWPANFEHAHPPVMRFEGYDESKAVLSAKRATELESQQRVLAVKRAGIDRIAARSSLRAVPPALGSVRMTRRHLG